MRENTDQNTPNTDTLHAVETMMTRALSNQRSGLYQT